MILNNLQQKIPKKHNLPLIDLTAKQAGSIGGQMVNNICPVRHMNFTRKNRTVKGYERQITYGFRVVV